MKEGDPENDIGKPELHNQKDLTHMGGIITHKDRKTDLVCNGSRTRRTAAS